MTRFSVWAPKAQRVDVVSDGEDVPMAVGERGWWTADIENAGPGTDYVFRLDGGEALPDPRSPWQPKGIDGPSRVVDHDAFAWQNEAFRAPSLGAAVIYELHIGTFTPDGAFDAAIEKLDHIVELGITHVELMPVAEFSGSRGWGYDSVDLYAPHHAYGGPGGLKRLVDACHGRGLAVLLDVVYNHLGPVGNYLERFGPYFTQRYGTPWGKAINFDDAGSDPVRQYVIDNALMWLRDYRIDGLRLDAVHAIYDASAIHILEAMQEAVEGLSAQTGRPLVLIAESDLNDPRLVWSRERGGYGLAAAWSDDFHHSVHSLLTGEREGYYADFGAIADLAKALQQGYVYDGAYSIHRGRTHGRPPTGVSPHQFVVVTQDHDQVGNRAQGERLVQLVGERRARIAAALLLTSPFVPMLFQGEEWAASTPFQYFTDHADPKLGRAVTEGRRREFAAFGWQPESVPDPQSEATFTASKLDWAERDRQPHAAMLAWYRELIALRKRLQDLNNDHLDDVRVEFNEEARWLWMLRGHVVVAVNLGKWTADIDLPTGSWRILLSSEDATVAGLSSVELTPDSVAILYNDAGVSEGASVVL